ncbi:MAG: hypothetical protein V2A74_02890 [bacterium]
MATEAGKKRTGPKWPRLMLYFLALVLTGLLLWLWSYILRDIGDVTMPDWVAVQNQFVKSDILDQKASREKDLKGINEEIQDRTQSQRLLRDSTDSARDTMNQLLENQRRLSERNIQLSEAEQAAIGESQRLFLENQKEYQALNQEIVKLTNEQRRLRNEIDGLEDQLKPMREEATKEYNKQLAVAQRTAGIIKLSFLLPLLLVSLWLLGNYRKATFGILTYPLAVSAFWKTAEVVHAYFPQRYFKYIALVVLIAAVLAVMVYIIKLIVRPKKDYLLRQFQEAYQRRACPICGYPVQRGILKDLIGGKKGLRGLIALPAGVEEKPAPYSCPSCGEKLFEECAKCGEIRHSLLPHCAACGNEKEIPETGSAKPSEA